MIKTYYEILDAKYQNKILAHTSFNRKQETLVDHSKKTLEYCDFLIKNLSLEENFTKMLSKLVSEKQIPLFLELIRSIIYYHDLGKVNPVFQREIMKNELSISTGTLDSTHSFYGKILYDNLFYRDFDNRIAELGEQHIFFLLSQTIDRHHSSLMDINFLAKKLANVKQKLDDLYNAINPVFINKKSFFKKDFLYDLYSFKNDSQSDIRRIFNEEQRESLFYLYKSVYSLLILSDYYATLDFMQNMTYFDKISIISPELINKCEKSFYNVEFNKKLYDKTYCDNLLNSDVSHIDELDKIRTRILLEADKKLEESLTKCPDQRIFYLNVPTGGGKTNVSLKLALTLLKNRNIKRVFYVFPFVNLIEQNHDVIKDTFGLNEDLSAVYSTSTWKLESENKEENLQYVLDNEFLNYPFVVISNVNFFNTFVKSGKTSNYRLINLANSVVIIDEIQSLNDKDWTLFNDLIEYASKYLNIYFIIMSATLPKLDTLSDNKTNNALNLINNPYVYSSHPLFKKRVSIEYRDDVNNLDQFTHVLNDEFRDDMNKILLVVNTIKNSVELYKKIKNEQNLKDFHVYLLNSTILPHRRREIIKQMKEEHHKIILISTQSVEAGMDIDCDFGIRDFAVFDSIEQIAGRINRNSKIKEQPYKLIITNLKDGDKKIASYIYEDTYRWETIEKHFMSDKNIKEFLKDRLFDKYYSKVLENISKMNSFTPKKTSQSTVKNVVRGMDFHELNQTDIIKQGSISFMINTNIPKNEFSNAELNDIQKKGIECQSDEINGKSVWLKYCEFIKNFQKGHVDKKIETKIWSSILSKFMINIPYSQNKEQNLVDLNNGIPLLKSEFYSDEEGVNRELIDRNSFEINPISILS